MLYISLSQFLLLSLAIWPLGQLQTLPGSGLIYQCAVHVTASGEEKRLPTFGRCSSDADKCARSETRRADPIPVENPESANFSLSLYLSVYK